MLSCLVILVVSFTKNVDEIMLATTPSTKKVMLPVTRPWAKKPRESPIEGDEKKTRSFCPANFWAEILSCFSCWELAWWGLMKFLANAWLGGGGKKSIVIISLCTFHLGYLGKSSNILAGWKHTFLGRLPSQLRSQEIFHQCFYSVTLGILMFFTAAIHVARKMHHPQVKINHQSPQITHTTTVSFLA